MSGTNYFSYFPQTTYQSTSGDKIVTNIFKRTKIRSLSAVIKSAIFYKYTIQDGERPEDIAERYYGDTQYYWVVLYANDIINIYSQWPRSYRDFENYIISKYGSIESVSNISNIHHYEDGDGNWITTPTYTYYDDSMGEEIIGNSSLVTVYDYEYKLNENKREINIIKKEYLKQIIGEMNNIFNT